MSEINTIRPAEQTLVMPAQQISSSEAVSERQGAVESGKVLPAQPEQVEESQEDLKTAVSNIADFVQTVSRELQFSVDDESGRTVMTVLDRETQEVVRQVPSEEVLVMSRIIKRMTSDSPKGVLLQSEA